MMHFIELEFIILSCFFEAQFLNGSRITYFSILELIN